jgi:hypothetical protein
MKKKFALIIPIAAFVLLALFAVGIKYYRQNLTVTIPQYSAMEEKPVWLDQQWTQQQRDWFHHADQGTQTFGIPYEWFIALEQPALSLSSPGLFSDTAYLDRYGFIPSYADPGNSDLPVGFAHGGRVEEVSGETLFNPKTKKPMTSRRRRPCAHQHSKISTSHRTLDHLHPLGSRPLQPLRRPRPRSRRQR